MVRNVLAKNNVTTMEYPPYFPDLAAADFYLFSGLKTAWKERRSSDATDIIENATKELKRISLNDFQECFQHLCSRWQKCIFAQWNCFEENVT